MNMEGKNGEPNFNKKMINPFDRLISTKNKNLFSGC